MESYQDEVDDYAAQVDSLIEQYENECLGQSPEPSQCGSIKANICQAGQQARSYQDRVDTKVTAFQDEYDTAFPKYAEANAAAVQNSAAAMGLVGRFPTDHNITAECYAEAIPGWAWYDYWDPTKGQLGDSSDYHYNRASNSLSDGVLVEVEGYRINSKSPTVKREMRDIRLSPDGTWYLEGYTAKFWLRSYSQTYWRQRKRWRCEPALTCDPDPGTCTFPEWPDFERIWWNQGWPSEGSCVGSCKGFGCWIWSPLPEPNWGAFGSDDWHLHTKRQGGLEDVSEKRDEWLDEHNNWYDEHEQYDDRHEAYC
jgi:hypothetical protein